MTYPFELIKLPYSEAPPIYWLNIVIHQSVAALAPIFDKNPLVLLPHRIANYAESFLETHKLTDVLTFDDLLDPRVRTFAESPSDAAYRAFDARAEGRPVVLLDDGPRTPGLMAAMLTLVESPHIHPEKVIYPVRASGYELFPDQVGYIWGWADGRRRAS